MRFRPLILLAILPLFSACSVVQSKNPLGPRSAAVRDERLEGMWKVDEGKGKFGYVFFAYHAHGGDGTIMELTKNDAGQVASAKYDFFVTRSSKHDYLNVTNGHSSDESVFSIGRGGTYSFAEYHFNWLGELVYSMVGGDGIAKAVDEGKLKGKVDRDSKGAVNDIYLTDTSKRMLDFIESSKPKDVFEMTTKLTWVGGP
jgi:hypothetical protein